MPGKCCLCRIVDSYYQYGFRSWIHKHWIKRVDRWDRIIESLKKLVVFLVIDILFLRFDRNGRELFINCLLDCGLPCRFVFFEDIFEDNRISIENTCTWQVLQKALWFSIFFILSSFSAILLFQISYRYIQTRSLFVTYFTQIMEYYDRNRYWRELLRNIH